MKSDIIDIIKGISPNVILARELKKRNISCNDLAMAICEPSQVVCDLVHGKCRFTKDFSHKIELEFGLEEGFLMLLQSYHDEQESRRELTKEQKPNLSKFRRNIFWDTDFDSINWIESKQSIIQRVFERGNIVEINEVIDFYGVVDIQEALKFYNGLFLAVVEENMKKYLLKS